MNGGGTAGDEVTEAHQRLISLEKENVSKRLGSTYYVPGIVLSKLYIPRDI